MKNIGKVVAAARKDAKLTQKELSIITGIRQADISRIEKGGNVTIDILDRLASGMGKKLNVEFVDNPDDDSNIEETLYLFSIPGMREKIERALKETGIPFDGNLNNIK